MKQERNTKNLNLDWKFFKGDEPVAWYKGFDDSGWQTVTLPHDWSVTEPFSMEHSSGTGYLPGGTGWYRKTFYLPKEAKGKKIYITFEGVYNNSQVWCNSYYIGKRPYGYSTFTYDITDFAAFGADRNVVSVKVNHKDVADSRWFTGSGIYRNVYLTITDLVHFSNYGVFATTPEVSDEHATVKVNSRILNETGSDAEIRVIASLFDKDGNIVASTQVTKAVNGGAEAEVDQEMHIPNPKLWSPDSPYLYNLFVEILRSGKVVDCLKIPIGIRWFTFDADRGFCLNGKFIKIKGVCIHHDAGCLGAAVPKKVWARRLKSLKEMGCNAIRTSHNPPAPDLLDLCDSMGFLVMDEAFDEWEGVKNKWSEGHNVYPPKYFGYYEDFPLWGERDIKDMVMRDRNHPSVIMWSIGNELDYPNDPYCHSAFISMARNDDANKPELERVYDPNRPNAERLVKIARRLVRYVKECDTTRPVTAAAALPELSNLTGFTGTLDIVGYNYKEHLYEEDHRKYPDRVIYGSENSSSIEAWLAVRDNDYICGQFIWTGIDYLGEARGWPVRASQTGFLDLAGYKKVNYYYRQSLWSQEPIAFLAVRKCSGDNCGEDRKWNFGEPHWNWKTGEDVEVICYTNCEEAELFINGISAGTKKLKDFPEQYIAWKVKFKEGTVSVAVRNSDGLTLCTCELKTASSPSGLLMSSDTARLSPDGEDIAHVDIMVVDCAGLPVYHADNMIRVTIEGPGEIIGLENGDVSDLEPYSSRKRKAYHGRLIAYVKAGTEAGQIIVKAEAEDLAPASVTVSVSEK